MLAYWLRDWCSTRKYSSFVMLSSAKSPSLATKYLILVTCMVSKMAFAGGLGSYLPVSAVSEGLASPSGAISSSNARKCSIFVHTIPLAFAA